MDSFSSMMEGLFEVAVQQSHLSPLAIKGIGVVLLLLFLTYAVRNPGKSLKFLVVISLFIALAYVAYDVIQLGVERNREIQQNQPDLSSE